MTPSERLAYRNRQNGYAQDRRDRARAAGICTTCCVRPREAGRCRCVECNQRHRKPITTGATP